MQQADYHRHRPTSWMQESVFMHKSPTPVRHSRMNQARSEEEEKERTKDRKDRGQEAGGKATQQNKNTSEEWKKSYLWRTLHFNQYSRLAIRSNISHFQPIVQKRIWNSRKAFISLQSSLRQIQWCILLGFLYFTGTDFMPCADSQKRSEFIRYSCIQITAQCIYNYCLIRYLSL